MKFPLLTTGHPLLEDGHIDRGGDLGTAKVLTMPNFLRAALDDIRMAFRSTPPADDKGLSKDVERQLVQRTSRGNILLQQGKYFTPSEIDARRAKLLAR